MTPEKGKRPLPSSTSIIFPERPNNYQQWKIALQRVKILYLQGQWKECASQCTRFLSEARTIPLSLHTTCLNFYCALSNEALARSTHPLSAAKLHVLGQAKASYEAAASSLPSVLNVPGSDWVSEDRRSSSPDSSSSSAGSEILDYYQTSPGASGPHDETSSHSSIECESFPKDSPPMKPPPLRIRKSSLSTFEPTVDNPDDQLFLHTYTRKPSPAPFIADPPPSPSPAPSFTIPPPNTTWLHVCARERYNAHLTAFKEMLSNHICTVDTLINKTREAQAMRYFGKRLASYGEDEAAREADLAARKVRLRAGGWRRERFRGERYQGLCERALEEL